MFISKKEHERQLNYIKLLEARHTADCNSRIDYQSSLRKNQVPFLAFYAERLEYWKGQFDRHLSPEPHWVLVQTKGNNYSQWFNSQEEIDEYIKRINIKDGKRLIAGNWHIDKDKIDSYQILLKHPDPYTPEEIEVWAKEKVEEEMKGWMVVREGVYEPSPVSEFVRLHTDAAVGLITNRGRSCPTRCGE